MPLEAYTGSKESCPRHQTRSFGARPAVEYGSVLSQQSISGEIVTLILCVWKPGFFSNPVTMMKHAVSHSVNSQTIGIITQILEFKLAATSWIDIYLCRHKDQPHLLKVYLSEQGNH